MAGASIGATGALPTAASSANVPKFGESDFGYEVELSEKQWQDRLSGEEYEILRKGGTEFPTSSALWDDYREGAFYCKGCDLPLYSSDWRAPIEQGWVFFYHSHVDAVLTGIDRSSPYGPDRQMGGPEAPHRTLIEAHCRRCGSHLGHLVFTEGKLVHCINGTALRFDPKAA